MIWVDDGFATLATARSTQGVSGWTDGRTVKVAPQIYREVATPSLCLLCSAVPCKEMTLTITNQAITALFHFSACSMHCLGHAHIDTVVQYLMCQ